MKQAQILLKSTLVAAAITALVGCSDKGLNKRTENYDTVSEGSASGVTSTITAPGETAPPLLGTAPMTATNLDTTTALTIDPTLAADLPGSVPAPPSTGYVPAGPPMDGSYTPGQTTITPPRSEPTISITPSRPRETPPPTETAPPTDTRPPVENVPDPDEDEPADDDDDEQPPPPSTDTTATSESTE